MSIFAIFFVGLLVTTISTIIFRCDVTKESDWNELWAHAEAEFKGKVSVLVNNAGVNPGHGWRVCLNIMLTGVSNGTYLAIEKMGTSKVKKESGPMIWTLTPYLISPGRTWRSHY